MAYFPKKIKDNEIPTLVYLLKQLLVTYFGKEYVELTTEDYSNFVSDNDIANLSVKAVHYETIKKILALYKVDTLYRPKYKSIEFLIFGLLKEEVAFEDFQEEYKDNIATYFREIDYTIYQKNFEKRVDDKKELSIQKHDLGGAILQIDLSNAFTAKLLKDIEPVVGNIVSDTIQKEQKMTKLHSNSRINTRLALQEFSRQKNIDSIVAKALQFSHNNQTSDEPVDPDWMNYFFDMAKDTSNKNMQFIWAKILADEVDKPGSFSRRAVNAIKLINADEARLFTLLCNCLWEIYPGKTRADRVLIKSSDNMGYYTDNTWGFDGLLIRHLEDLGLVHETFMVLAKNEEYEITYFGRDHVLKPQERDVEVEMVRLTTVGMEIYDVVTTEANIEYYESTLVFFKEIRILKE